MIGAVRSKHASDGERMHSVPMAKDYLDRIFTWSYNRCPPHILNQIGTVEDFHKVKYLVLKQLWMRAFMSGFFTLWTRYSCQHFIFLTMLNKLFRFFEMVRLPRKHYHFNQVTPDDIKWPYDECHLENQKGWNSHVHDGGKMLSVFFFFSPQRTIVFTLNSTS
jgi:hypothetical protein